MSPVQEAYLNALNQIRDWTLNNIVSCVQQSDRIYVSFCRKDANNVRNIEHSLAVFGNGIICYREGEGPDWFFGENAGFANIYTTQDRVAEDLIIAWPIVKEKLLSEIETAKKRNEAILGFNV